MGGGFGTHVWDGIIHTFIVNLEMKVVDTPFY